MRKTEKEPKKYCGVVGKAFSSHEDQEEGHMEFNA
jgi:hypothetical protein